MDGISVIVCCYNSALRLPLTLEYLSKQKTDPHLNREVIIVNNNSKDDTVETALQCWKLLTAKSNLKIVDEPRPGLSYARDAGVKTALYNIIIFCDDDNLLAENYLQYSYELVKKTKHSGYGIWGGKPVAVFDENTKVPDWFEREKENYVVGAQAKQTGDISNRGYVWGAGMIILKQVYLNTINKKFPALLCDRSGEVLTSGGDSEISLRALIAGYKLYYDEDLVLQHYISKEKLTPEYNEDLKKGFISSNNLLNKYKIFVHYVSNRNFLYRMYYSAIYLSKYLLSKMNLKKLTAHDTAVLQALFTHKNFRNPDFDLMRELLKTRYQYTS